MPRPAVSLPVLSRETPQTITPTDVTQFVALEQCERFLRFRMAERGGQEFMEDYKVAPQRITPLLSLSGQDFEDGIGNRLIKNFPSVDYAKKYRKSHNRPANNEELIDEARSLKLGQKKILFQTRLTVTLAGWRLRGDVDLILLEKTTGGDLQILIGDTKSTVEVKVEHRLQVAFYRLMLEQILTDAGVSHAEIDTGIICRPPIDPLPEDLEKIETLRKAAASVFGLENALFEKTAEPEAYAQAARDLVLSEDSTARRVAGMPFESVSYCLSFKCDGCLYNEFCMKWSAETEDLALLPHMSGTDKEALIRVGITKISELAHLKDLVPGGSGSQMSLVPAAGQEDRVKRIGAAWSVGHRLDELIHRARSFMRSVKKDGTLALSHIPGTGNSTLPVSTPAQNPNLLRIFVDAQKDYLQDRVYLLGALVVACKEGDLHGRRTIVKLSDGPPDSQEKESKLLVDWTKDLLKAVVDLAGSASGAQGSTSAPIHLIFFNSHEQRVMLEALARNFPPILKESPPLFDFLTQIAAFDSPISTFLDEELRTLRNFPMTCQSLQSVAAYLKFDWNTPLPFRGLFRERLFDYLGKLGDDESSEWYTKRSRFSSSPPLEYAYAAWGQLPLPAPGKGDVFENFRSVDLEILVAFQARRLEALEHVTNSFHGNANTSKTPFDLPNLLDYKEKASDLAHALQEFVLIERMVELNDWKKSRHAPPERRVLLGDCLISRYLESDQDKGVAEQIRDNHVRKQKKDEFYAAYKAANPDKKRVTLTKEQKSECDWTQDDLRVRLRIETTGIDCDLHEALLLSNLREGDHLVLFSRMTVDERLPKSEQTPFTPTPKQMLYGQRVELAGIKATRKDSAGRVTEAFVEVIFQESRGGAPPHVFGSMPRIVSPGELYTLDPCPNDWYGSFLRQVVDGLCKGEENELHKRLKNPQPIENGGGLPGQQEFLEGLDAFTKLGLLHEFEKGKREFIGEHGRTPILLVQGPPGTGKSYSTAFAVFARVQAAMRRKQPCRVFLSCKTHAATDVLLKNVLEVQHVLQKLFQEKPKVFQKHFDRALLEVPLYRMAPNDPQPEGIISLKKDKEKAKGENLNANIIQDQEWVIVGITPGGVYRMLKDKYTSLFGNEFCDLLVLDEASQMNLPEAIMAGLALKPDAPVIVVGDHRQMPPIVKHDWDREARRTFRSYQVYESVFDSLRAQKLPMIRFEESFRLHATMAEFLRQEIYRHDGINYHSKRNQLIPAHNDQDEMVDAILRPDYPLVVVTHDESESQVRNPFEQSLIEPILRALTDPDRHGLVAGDGIGIVVPHRAQRAALQEAFPELRVIDPVSGLPTRSAIDTVERFQGGERTVILVSATESDRAYLLAASGFLLDPRRLTVAVSRAKRKMILVASKNIFSLFSPDEETFANSMLWKNLLRRSCPEELWSGTKDGVGVSVWGGRGDGKNSLSNKSN